MMELTAEAQELNLTSMKTLRRQPSPEATSDLEIETIGGEKVLAKPSNSTETSVALDYVLVQHELWQVSVIAKAKSDEGTVYGPTEIRRDFVGKRVLAYARDKDLEEAVATKGKVSALAAEIIARPLNLTARTVLQYAKRPRVRGKNQRIMIRKRRG
jgi:hypothetical protein